MVIRLVLRLNSSTRIWREIAYTACKDKAFVKIYMLTDTYHLLLQACINYFSLQWNIFSLPLVEVLYLCHYIISFSLFSYDKKFTSVVRIIGLQPVAMARFTSGNVKLKNKVFNLQILFWMESRELTYTG